MKHYNTAIIVAVAIIFSVLVPHLSFATPSTPADLDVTPTKTAIKITWSANADDIEGYYIYWGKSEDILDIRIAINDPNQTVYDLIRLNPNTTYYVAISAFDAVSLESPWSETVSVTTLKEKTALSAPSGFNDLITDSTVPLRWDKNKEADLAGYKIYIGTSSNDYSDVMFLSEININAKTITDIDSATRYYFAISAFDISENESEKSDEIIVDTLIDILAPNIPANIIVETAGKNELTVSFDGNNKGMADIKGYKIYLGVSPGEYKTIVDLKNNNFYTFSDLSEGTTYYFSVTSYDYSDNESEKSDKVLMRVERIDLFANDSKGGCFIATAAFGNYDHPAVKIFRKFRDIYLLTNSPGKKLANLYYKFSPDIAKKIEQHSMARIVIITLLFPLLVICLLFVKIGFFSTLLLLFSLPFFYSLRKLKTIGMTTVVVLLICTNTYAQGDRDNVVSTKIGCFVPSDKAARDIYSASWLSVALSYERFLSENFSTDIGGWSGQTHLD